MFKFTPTAEYGEIKIPYFEEARADFAPYYSYYSNGKAKEALKRAKNEVVTELAKLGAAGVLFQDGYFQSGKKKRHGFNITFQYGGGRGMIRVAGLPLKCQETEKKLEGLKAQALMNVRDWLKAAVTSQVFSPGADILIPFMLVDHTPSQEKTVADYISQMQQLPRLNPKPDQAVLLGPGAS